MSLPREIEGQINQEERRELLPFTVESPPSPPEKEMFYGLAGEVVRTISPYSEAAETALLINFLTAFGSILGRKPFFIAGADKHYSNLFVALVGKTAKGRKGMSWSWIRELFRNIDEEWVINRTVSGLSSGEGLIWAVRDEQTKEDENGEQAIINEGINDKRLLVVEAEFASALKVMSRQGNTLSPLLRRAWDTGELQTLTKNCPVKATGAHISIIGHISREELIRLLQNAERASGFANRFIWLYVERSKLLPDGEAPPEGVFEELTQKVNQAIEFARSIGEIRRNEEAGELWRRIYPALSEPKPGLSGAIIARSEAQVMRLACLYALLSFSAVIKPEHLTAALALWEYSEASCRYIFGESGGNVIEAEILNALDSNSLSQNEIYKMFDGKVSATIYKEALANLHRQGIINFKKEPTQGRPKIIWYKL